VQYYESAAGTLEDRVQGYFNTPQGFFDRLQMISIDDALNNHTQQFGTYGILPVIQSFENLIPRFIWPDKPPLLSGNTYAHEVGLLAEADTSTGVSFSSTAVAFHLLGWPGIFLLAPAIWLLLFTIFDSLCGDVRKAPWGLLVMVAIRACGSRRRSQQPDLHLLLRRIWYHLRCGHGCLCHARCWNLLDRARRHYASPRRTDPRYSGPAAPPRTF